MLKKMHDRALRAIRAWREDTRGVVAMIFVFCIPAFIAAAGVAVDLSQAYNVKTRLSNALDKAALAAGSTNGSATYIQQQVINFFNANYPSGTLGTPHDVIVSLANGMVDVQASSTVHTVFMGIFGQPTLEVTAETIVKREVSGLELVLVMDNTGSMAQTAGGSVSKIDAAKTAADTLFGILFGSSSNVPQLYIGIVPFSQDVNIDTSNVSWTAADSYNWGPTSWMGCVEARETNGMDITDDPPSVALFPKYYSPCDSYNTWYSSVSNTDYATNGDFSSSSGWTTGSWILSGGVATATSSSSTLSRSSSIAHYTSYDVSYDITSYTSGTVHSTIGGRSGTSESGVGHYEEIVKSSSSSTIGLVGSSFTGAVDNFSVKTLTSCGSGPSYVYASPLNTSKGPNAYCAQPLQSMTNDEPTLEAAVASMAPAGDTMIDLGMAWAWRMLSPRWRGVWPGFMSTNNLPLDYDSPDMTKAVILMTDGDNTFANGIYHAYGYLSQGRIGTTNSGTATTIENTLTLDVCSSLKSHDVLVYTIALGTSFTSTSLNMLQSCATGPAYFFNSPTTTDLQNNFTTIANQLNSLHITH